MTPTSPATATDSDPRRDGSATKLRDGPADRTGGIAALAARSLAAPSVLLTLFDAVVERHVAAVAWPLKPLPLARSLAAKLVRESSGVIAIDNLYSAAETERFRTDYAPFGWFAAAPIAVDGRAAAGALCVAGPGARVLTPADRAALNTLAELSGDHLSRGATIGTPERAPIEHAMHEAHELLDALLDTLPDSVYFKDAQSRFLRISRSLAARLGLDDPRAAIARSDADFFGPDHAIDARSDERRIIETGEPVVAKMEREVSLDGGERWVSTTKVALRNRAGLIRGTLGVSRDVTDLKRAEDELAVARDVAIESARLKAEFLANMSHEIRTPLNAVVGMTGLLLDTPLTPEQIDFATTVRSSADLLLGIINDILDFSKIDAGKMTIETIDFDLTQVIEETADLVADPAQAKGIELVTWLPPHVPRAWRGDPGRIRQVLVNILGNAVKFTERGEVVVQVGVVESADRVATLHLQVRDTGVGIPVEAQGRLFNAFSQADGSTTRRYGGTGLGLAICKQLVTLMGGEIGFDSVPGRGSTFWFTLPLERQSAGADLAPASPLPLEGARVLIVDDNATNREILRHQAAAWKMQHDCVASGPEALAALYRERGAARPYDVVILDMQMPDMDGLDVARAILADPKLKDTSIVILTSLAYHPDDAEIRRMGIAAYLTKPVKQSRLFDALAAATRRAAVEAPAAGAPSKPETRADFRSLRVLLAEDNAVNQKVALRQLLKMGIAADAVADGSEVLEVIDRARYDVILMDCQMPELDGYATTRRIREREAARPGEPRRHVIALTAHALQGDREVCLASGMDDYLSKPMRLEELTRALDRYLASRSHATT